MTTRKDTTTMSLGQRYWMIHADDGRRYCWSKQPTMVCVVARAIELAGGVPSVEWETYSKLLGMDAAALMALVKRANYHGERKRVNGKLTDRCEACGGRVELRGYRCWIEAKFKPSDASARIADRLGAQAATWRQVEGPWYQPSRKAAQEWARARVAAVKR